jgi:hypothetical protein
MANGITVPGRRHRRGMRGIHAHMADFMIVRIDDDDLVRLLDQLHADIPNDKRDASRPTLPARARGRHPARFDLAELPDELRCLWLQDRVGVIADKPIEVAGAAPVARAVRHRAGSRARRLKAATSDMRPHAGEIRDRGGAGRRLARRAGFGGRRRLPPSGRGHCCRHDRQQKQIPLLDVHDRPFRGSSKTVPMQIYCNS